MTEKAPQAVMQRLTDEISAERWGSLHMLYAAEAVVHQPIARDDSAVLRGRGKLRAYFEQMAATGVRLRASPITFIGATDPEIAIGQFRYSGENGFGMDRFEMEACFIWRVRDGLIVEATDFLSPALEPK